VGRFYNKRRMSSPSLTYILTLLCQGSIMPLAFGTRWSWVSSSRPGRFTPREKLPTNKWIEGWVGTTAGLDAVEQSKFLVPATNPTPALQTVARRYTDWAIPASPYFNDFRKKSYLFLCILRMLHVRSPHPPWPNLLHNIWNIQSIHN
jgi:hypothetical protein